MALGSAVRPVGGGGGGGSVVVWTDCSVIFAPMPLTMRGRTLTAQRSTFVCLMVKRLVKGECRVQKIRERDAK